MNIAESVAEFAQKFGDSKKALIFDDTGEQWTYQELNQDINRIANGLESIGVIAGTRVALMLKSKPELILCSYGIYRVGAIYVALNFRLKEKETKHIIKNSGAEVLICDESILSLVEEIRDECEGLKKIIVYGKKKMDNAINFSDLIEGKPSEYTADSIKNEIGAIMYTGGTTGLPKGVVLSHSGIIGDSTVASKRLQYDENTVVVSANPMFHIGGMAGGPYFAFLNGGTLILQENFDAEKYVAAVKKYQADHIWGVPAFFYSINNLPESKASRSHFSSVKLGFSAAGIFYTAVRKAFEERFGIKIYQYYGLTENSPGVTVENPQSSEEREYESVGTPLPNVDIKIVDEEDNTLPIRQTGELCVKSPYLMKEYWNNPEATKEAMRGGWLHTGDQGFIDEKGNFYLMGRKHDLIIVGGSNVYPAEVEKIIMESDDRIKDVAVVGMHDDRLGEKPMAFVILKADVQMSEKEFIDLARSKMAHYKAPRSVEFIDTLPMTTVGKVDKKFLQNNGGNL
ncbi:acyl--CoA ligase [bacterium]|nr:acyl--CoA ligase [bacterium]